MVVLANWMKNEESGQGMVEYALIIMIVAIALIFVLTTIEIKLEGKYNAIVNSIPG